MLLAWRLHSAPTGPTTDATAFVLPQYSHLSNALTICYSLVIRIVRKSVGERVTRRVRIHVPLPQRAENYHPGIWPDTQVKLPLNTFKKLSA